MRDVTDLVGRILLSAIFFFEAIDSALYFDQTRNSMTCWAKSSDFGHIYTGLCPEQLMKKKNRFNPIAFLNTQTQKSFSAGLDRSHIFRTKSGVYVAEV